jgi:hypothetical protein
VSAGALVGVGGAVGVDVGGTVGATVGAGRGVFVGNGAGVKVGVGRGGVVVVGFGRGGGVIVGFGRGVDVAVGDGRGVLAGAAATCAGSVARADARVAMGETRRAAVFVPVGAAVAVAIAVDDDARGCKTRAVAVGLPPWSVWSAEWWEASSSAAVSLMRRAVAVGSGESGRYVAGRIDSMNRVGAASAVPGGASGTGLERWFAGRTT